MIEPLPPPRPFHILQLRKFSQNLVAGRNQIYPDPVLYLNGGNLEVVPEPGTWALMLGGLAALILIRRSRRTNS